jgi:hypothetical protein
VGKPSKEMKLEERIECVLCTQELELDGNAYMGKYELNRDSIKRFILDSLRIRKQNQETGDVISLNRESAKELVKHDLSNEYYSKTLAHIPEIIEKMHFLEEMKPDKKTSHFDKYSYYITGVNIDGKPYTILSVIGHKGVKIYYDQNVFEGTKREVFNIAKQELPDNNKYGRLSKILNTETQGAPELKTGDDYSRASTNKYSKFSEEKQGLSEILHFFYFFSFFLEFFLKIFV